jgi:VanZ family protein
MSPQQRQWGAVLVWMAVIFTLSTDLGSGAHTSRFIEPLLRWLLPQASPALVHRLHFLLRKAGHVTEYALLALLVLRAVRAGRLPSPAGWSWRAAGVTLLVCAAYAATDEFHQSFVPSRGSSPVDVLIDSSGAALALVLAFVAERWRQKRLEFSGRMT